MATYSTSGLRRRTLSGEGPAQFLPGNWELLSALTTVLRHLEPRTYTPQTGNFRGLAAFLTNLHQKLPEQLCPMSVSSLSDCSQKVI